MIHDMRLQRTRRHFSIHDGVAGFHFELAARAAAMSCALSSASRASIPAG